MNSGNPRERFRSLLYDLFQLDASLPHSGVYRLLGGLRGHLRRFVEELLASGESSSTTPEADFPREDTPTEVYNHLIRFFSRYFQRGDFIPQLRLGDRVEYGTPYAGQEIFFHWATREHYYVKSGDVAVHHVFSAGGISVHFRLRRVEDEKGNQKAARRYYGLSSPPLEEGDRSLVVWLDYREAPASQEGEKTLSREHLLQQIRDCIRNSAHAHLLQQPGFTERLEKEFHLFTRRQHRDFFIHRNLGEFLRRELRRYVATEVLPGSEEAALSPVERQPDAFHRALRVYRTADTIIHVLDALEKFKKRLWEAKGLVLHTRYVITLDRLREHLSPGEFEDLAGEILGNTAQVEEWQRLFRFPGRNTSLKKPLAILRQKKWATLPVDTGYFPPEFQLRLLSAISRNVPLGQFVEGILLHSDNFRALTLLEKTLAERVQCIYIDPPFNKEREADYLYKVGYKDSTWLTLLENRIRAAMPLMRPEGAIFVRCDYNGSMYVRLLLDELFGKEQFRNELIVNRTRAKQRVEKQFVVQTESLFLYGRSERFAPRPVERPTPPRWYPLLHFPRAECRPRSILGREFYPPPNRRWALSQERIDQMAAAGKVRINSQMSYVDCRGETVQGMPELLYDSEAVGNEWLDIPGYAQRHHFATENAEALLRRVIESSTRPGDWVMDFFLGSGTTVAVAHQMGRRWIGIEMGQHFWEVILPRMKRVLFGERSALARELNWRGGGVFKYQVVEQFEDTLENLDLESPELATAQSGAEHREPALEQLWEALCARRCPAPLNDPFRHHLAVYRSHAGPTMPVDWPESFAYFMGMTVQRIRFEEALGRPYLAVLGEKQGEPVAAVWRPLAGLSFARDREVILRLVQEWQPRYIYANGDAAVPGFRSVEVEVYQNW